MQQCSHRDPEHVARQVEKRIEGLPSVREQFCPTGVEAHVAPDHVVVLLPFALTPGEVELVARGAPGAVLELRHELQMVMKAELVEAVETETDRPVSAFVSANHLDPNIGVETFLLG